MKLDRIILIAMVLTANLLIFAPSPEAKAEVDLSPHCTALNNPRMDNLWALTATGGPGTIPTIMYAGETIYVDAGPPVALFPTEINLFINDEIVATAPYPGGSIIYTLQIDTLVWAVGAHTGGHSNGVTWNISCSPLPPGEDMVLIPDTAVSGAFVTTTSVYAQPAWGAEIPGVVLEAGKTVHVYGLDNSGQFYKVMLAGKFFWTPASTIGPNFDEVWQGRPLPTLVVE